MRAKKMLKLIKNLDCTDIILTGKDKYSVNTATKNENHTNFSNQKTKMTGWTSWYNEL